MFDLENYRNMFFEESDELFETIDTILLDVEVSKRIDEDCINPLFRALHTLKGNSASVELNMFAALAHELEFFIDKLRNGDLIFEESMSNVLIEGVDTLKEVLDLEIDAMLNDDEFTEIKESLLSKLSSFSKNVNSSPVQIQKVSYIPSEDDDFGFFDENEELTINQEDNFDYNENFGFFDLETEKSSKTDDENFGFFDLETENETEKSSKSDDENFGFFDNLSDSQIVFSSIDDKKEKTELSQQKDKPAKMQREKKSSTSIRVNLDKIDNLMNNIGELVTAHSMLAQYATSVEDSKIKSDLLERFEMLDRHIRELQESVMSVRMVPIETIFSKFPKIVRDTASKINKHVNFTCSGEGVEIDKVMIEGLTDPLMHIVRNAIDHGIELPDIRKAVGKQESGTVNMHAEQANGQIIIRIQDDGAGINIDKICSKAIENGLLGIKQLDAMTKVEKTMLIFSPGLSTASEVTSLSGRGVGMDVVMSNIKNLGGVISVDTEIGLGTIITIALPLTLAILDGLNISVGDSKFILPISVILETINPEPHMIKHVGDESSKMLMLREEFIPIIRMHDIFNIKPKSMNICDSILIIVRSATSKVAIAIDEFMDQQQFVIKPLDKNFRNAKGIGGATVLGDGSIGLVIDTMNLMSTNKNREE